MLKIQTCKIISTISLILSIQFTLLSQPIGWRNPINGKVLLSGTFGELRGNHYHGGIDIKPSEGGHQPVLAVADGYVKTIKIHGGSYGNALLLQHKDGFQSLYGHLNGFERKIDSIAYSIQYRDSSFQINEVLDTTKLPVKQGDVIGYMGNTGYSFGQHLHFEVRHISGTHYNPLKIIPQIEDKTSPRFRKLRLNYLDANGREYRDELLSVKNLGANKFSAGNIKLNGFYFSIAVDVVDLHEETYNQNGIYQLDMYVNDSLYYRINVDSLTSHDRQYYNNKIDYTHSDHQKAIFHNLQHQSIYYLPIANTSTSGLLKLTPFKSKEIQIVASDFQGNKSTLHLTLSQVDQVQMNYNHIYNFVVGNSESQKIELDHYTVLFPKNSLGKEKRLYVFEEQEVIDNQSQWILHLDKDRIPIFEDLTIQLRDHRPIKEKEKWVMASCTDNSIYPQITYKSENAFIAKVGRLGNYCLIQDTIPPTIQLRSQRGNGWIFKISDNLFPFSQLDIEATIDGKWALVKEEFKKNTITFSDFDRFKNGQKHNFILSVTDGCGNKSVFESEL